MISREDTPTIDTAIHAANDCITPLRKVPGASQSGFIESVTLHDKKKANATIKVAFFKGSITAAAVNDPFTISSYADMKKHIKTIELSASNYEDFGSAGSQCRVDGLGLNFETDFDSDGDPEELYYQAYTTDTPIYDNPDDLCFEFGALNNGNL